jgi:hypothetical protein
MKAAITTRLILSRNSGILPALRQAGLKKKKTP